MIIWIFTSKIFEFLQQKWKMFSWETLIWIFTLLFDFWRQKCVNKRFWNHISQLLAKIHFLYWILMLKRPHWTRIKISVNNSMNISDGILWIFLGQLIIGIIMHPNFNGFCCSSIYNSLPWVFQNCFIILLFSEIDILARCELTSKVSMKYGSRPFLHSEMY